MDLTQDVGGKKMDSQGGWRHCQAVTVRVCRDVGPPLLPSRNSDCHLAKRCDSACISCNIFCTYFFLLFLL